MKMIKGDTLEKQIKHIDRILKLQSRRLHKTVTGVITPFPISGYCEYPKEDVVLRYMFPASGKITVGGMFVENMPKHGINIETIVYQKLTYISKTAFSKRQSIMIEPNANVEAGDRLLIKVASMNEEEVVSGIWIAFLWTPAVKDSEIRPFLIDALKKGDMDALYQM